MVVTKNQVLKFLISAIDAEQLTEREFKVVALQKKFSLTPKSGLTLQQIKDEIKRDTPLGREHLKVLKEGIELAKKRGWLQ
jgi:hypothetical protein